MDEYPSPLDGVFHALSDPTRRAMLAALVGGERSVGALAAPFQISLAAASKHIRALERAGLLERTVRGRTHLCALRAAPLAQAETWLRRYADSRNLRLDAPGTPSGNGEVTPSKAQPGADPDTTASGRTGALGSRRVGRTEAADAHPHPAGAGR